MQVYIIFLQYYIICYLVYVTSSQDVGSSPPWHDNLASPGRMTQSCMTSAHRSTKSGRKNGVSCQSEIWTAGSSSTWKVDGANSHWSWFIMAPYFYPPFGSCAIYFHYGVYVLWFRLFYLIVYLYVYRFIFLYCTCTHADAESALKHLNDLDV